MNLTTTEPSQAQPRNRQNPVQLRPNCILRPSTGNLPRVSRYPPLERGEYELADAIDLLIYSGYSVETQPFEGWKVNVNTEADITRAEQLLHSGQ